MEFPEDESSCRCGRAFPVIEKVHGRKDDYIKLSNGRRIGRMDHIFKGLSGIAEAQIVQDEIDAIKVRLVPLGEFVKGDQQALMENARKRLGSNIEIELELVDSIARTGNGKFRSVVCNI